MPYNNHLVKNIFNSFLWDFSPDTIISILVHEDAYYNILYWIISKIHSDKTCHCTNLSELPTLRDMSSAEFVHHVINELEGKGNCAY
jgi:hypothetical protein